MPYATDAGSEHPGRSQSLPICSPTLAVHRFQLRLAGGCRTCIVKLAKSNPTDKFGRLLAIIILTFIVSGIGQDWATSLASFLNLVLIVVAFRTTSLTVSVTRASVLAGIAVAAVIVAIVADNGSDWSSVSAFAQSALLGVLVVAILRAVLKHEEVTIQTIVGAIAAYALIGMAFSWFFLGMDSVDNTQFSMDPTDATAYPEFSFIVLTTVGFGNQLPTASFSARFTVIEAMTGQIFLATFVARLVSLYPRRTLVVSADPDVASDLDTAPDQ
jgi:hypothetical protein